MDSLKGFDKNEKNIKFPIHNNEYSQILQLSVHKSHLIVVFLSFSISLDYLTNPYTQCNSKY